MRVSSNLPRPSLVRALGLVIGASALLVGADTVTIQAVGIADEAHPDNGAFVFTRGLSSGSATMALLWQGGAVNGVDYELVAPFVRFMDGATSATMAIRGIQDFRKENTESVACQMAPSATFAVAPNQPSSATIPLLDGQPRIGISATGTLVEGGLSSGRFTVSLQGPALNVPMDVVLSTVGSSAGLGTDLTNINTTVRIPAFLSSVDLEVFPLQDSLREGSEQLWLTVTSQPTYDISLTATAAVVAVDDDGDVDTVSIAPPATSMQEGAAPGFFVLTRSHGGPALTVSVTATTAVRPGVAQPNGVDVDLSALELVTFPVGINQVQLPVSAVLDVVEEGPEVLNLEVIPGSGYVVDISAAQAAVVVRDGERRVQVVSEGLASERGTSLSSFLFTRSDAGGATRAALVWSGTAIPGIDYTPGPMVIEFSGSATQARIPLTILSDAQREAEETIIVTVSPSATVAILPGLGTATLNIIDAHPLVSVESEGSLDESMPGQSATATFTLIGPPLTTNLSLGVVARINSASAASDVFVPATVVLLAGQTQVSTTIQVINDMEREETEVVDISLVTSGLYTQSGPSASIDVIDNDKDVVWINGVESLRERGASPGKFRLSRNFPGPDLTVMVEYSGTAAIGVDFINPGQLMIPQGSTYADIAITPVADALVEGTEVVTITLVPGENYDLAAGTAMFPIRTQLTIADDVPVADVARVFVTGDVRQERGGTEKSFIFQRGVPGPSASVNVIWSGSAVNGVDYEALPTTIVWPAGATQAVYPLVPIADLDKENTETITGNLVAVGLMGVAAPNSATMFLIDTHPQVSIRANGALREGSATQATVVITLEGPVLGVDLTVRLSDTGGTAVPGLDTTDPDNAIVIPAGATQASFQMLAQTDATLEGDEILTISLVADASYDRVASAQAVSIPVEDADDLRPRITVAARGLVSERGTSTGGFVLTRVPVGPAAQVVVSWSGSATQGQDVVALPTVLTFPEGAATVAIPVIGIGDVILENNEDITLTLLSSATMAAGMPDQASLVLSDEHPVLSLSASGSLSEAASGALTVTVQLTGPVLEVDIPFFMTATGGTAIPSLDLRNDPAGARVLTAGQSTFAVIVNVNNDALSEGTEFLGLSLEPSSQYNLGISAVSVPIDDDDAAPLTILNEPDLVTPIVDTTWTHTVRIQALGWSSSAAVTTVWRGPAWITAGTAQREGGAVLVTLTGKGPMTGAVRGVLSVSMSQNDQTDAVEIPILLMVRPPAVNKPAATNAHSGKG